jgi:hypothetical protein
VQAVVDGPGEGRLVEAEAAGGVALGVHVHEEHAAAEGGEASAEVHGGGGLADAAFLVDDCDDAAHFAPAR